DEASEPETPVLDTEILSELDRLYQDPRQLNRLIQEYERVGSDLLDKIAEVCAARDYPGFCEHVHALKVNAANVGASKLIRVCLDAEAGGVFEFRRHHDELFVGL